MRFITNDSLVAINMSEGMYSWFNQEYDIQCNLDNEADISKFVANEDILTWYMGVTDDMEALDMLLKYIASHTYAYETEMYQVVGSLKYAIQYGKRNNVYHIITHTTQPATTKLRYKDAYHLYKYIDLLIMRGNISILDIMIYKCFDCNSSYYSNLPDNEFALTNYFTAEYVLAIAYNHICEDVVLSELQTMSNHFTIPITSQAFAVAVAYKWYDVFNYMLSKIDNTHTFITSGLMDDIYNTYKDAMPASTINAIKEVSANV